MARRAAAEAEAAASTTNAAGQVVGSDADSAAARGIDDGPPRGNTRSARAARAAEARAAESSATATPAAESSSAGAARGRGARAKAAAGKGKGKGKAAAKKRKRDDSDDDDMDDDYEGFNTFDLKLPDVGQMAFCAECDSRFKVTAYSKASVDGDGLLCTPCGRKTARQEKDAVKRAGAAKRTKRLQARKALDAETTGPKSLKDLCIKVILALDRMMTYAKY